jgi:hypothetical protein
MLIDAFLSYLSPFGTRQNASARGGNVAAGGDKSWQKLFCWFSRSLQWSQLKSQ